MADAVARELLLRNPASLISPPKVRSKEVVILSPAQVKTVLEALGDSEIYPHTVILLSTGIRRGELVGLQWGDIDFDEWKLKIERAIEGTKKGLRIKPPKTSHGRRIIALPAIALDVLREQRKSQLEIRMRLGIGKLLPTHYVFGEIEGSVRHPDWITNHWRHLVKVRELPRVTLNALRHTHALRL